MKKIFFFQLLFLCLQADAQKPKNTTLPKLPVKKELPGEITENTSAFISPIVSIPYKGLVTPPTAAQAKDHLLWYKGKKIDDSTLITPNATLVRWSKPRDIVIVQPKKDPFAKMLTELQKNEAVKEAFYNKISEKRNVLTLYPDIENILKEFDHLKKLYADALKNIINLPATLPPSASIFKSSWTKGGTASVPNFSINNLTIPSHIKKAYEEVMALKKNYPSIEFPAPPEQNLGICYQCDGKAQNQHDTDTYKWHHEFTKYEADLVQRSLAISKSLETLKLHGDPEAIQIESDLEKINDFAFARMNNKVDLLIRRYGKDFPRLQAIFVEAISLERQKLIVTGDDASYEELITRISAMLDGFEKYMEQQMDARNYDLVLNAAFFIGIERQRQLLGMSDGEKLWKILEKIRAFNRFKIDLKIGYEAERDDECGTKSKVTATNLNPVYVSLGRQDCRFTLFGYDDRTKGSDWYNVYSGVYEIPLSVTNGSGTEALTRDDGSCYTKSHDLSGLNLKFDFPLASLSLCENKNEDTLQFEPALGPYNQNDKRFSYLHSFMTEMVNDGYPENLPEEIEQIEDELDELDKNVKDKETQTFKKPSLKELESQYRDEMRRKQLALKVAQYEERDNPSTIIFDARNGSADIVDAETTMKYKGKEYSGKDDKAKLTIKIKVTHDPLPYKGNPKK